jgi:Fur family ferric uptake transcriptional regulator
VQSQFGFEIAFARTEIGGYCSHCQALRAKDAKEDSHVHGEKQAV